MTHQERHHRSVLCERRRQLQTLQRELQELVEGVRLTEPGDAVDTASATEGRSLIERLREQGLAPALEGGDGSVVVSRPDERRTGPRPGPTPLTLWPSLVSGSWPGGRSKRPGRC